MDMRTADGRKQYRRTEEDRTRQAQSAAALRCKENFAAGAGVSARTAYLTAFFAPVLILFVILVLSGVWPFGEECFLRTDMYHQYAPFFSELREKLQTGGSLLYSWDVGLGVNFAALYAYYLASPLNWLVVLCPENYVIEFMMLMVVAKLGLSGITMTWYLRDRFRTRNFGALLFGIFFALSGYLAAYYWNIMWLDCILLFPLIMRGAERLIEEKKGILYAAALGLSILSNYYISIMTCMFLVIYFIAENVLYAPHSFGEFVRRSLRFAFYSLLAGGLAAVLLLPEIAALQYTASADVTFPQTVTQYFTIIDMFARQLVGVETEQGLDHWPNIYCGVAVLPLLVLYVGSARIKLREKAVYLLMLLFFFLSFSLNVLNFIWHGFHYPNSLPARQSYIYIFLLLFVSFRAYLQLPHLRERELGRAFLLSAGFVLLCQKLVTAKHFAFWVFYVSLLFIAAYVLLLWLYRTGRLRRTAAMLLAFSVVLIEAAANTALTSITTTSRTAYTKDNADVRELVDTLFPSSEFFRVEKVDRKTKNDGAWLNFPSVSLFSSMANAHCTDFFTALGCEASTNAYSITGSTPFVNMLFSVRYGLYGAPQTDGQEKKFVESRGETYLYRNNFSLPLGFMIPEAMYSRWSQDLDNPALVQDALCDMLGTQAVLQPNAELPSENGADYAVTISEDGEYYAFVTNPQVKKVSVSAPSVTRTFDNVDRGYLLELGSCRAGDMVTMKSETDGQAMQAQIYRFDYSALREVYNRLSAQPLKLTVWEDDRLEGTVTVDAEALGYGAASDEDAAAEPYNTNEAVTDGRAVMFLSIPYDKGWKITVDGVQVEPLKLYDTFLGIPMETGEHQIVMTFMPQGLLPGAALSGFCLLLLALLAVCGAAKRRKNGKETAGRCDAAYLLWDGVPELEEDMAEDADGIPELEEELTEDADDISEAEEAAGDADTAEPGNVTTANDDNQEDGSDADAQGEADVRSGRAYRSPKQDGELQSVFHLKQTKQDLLERLSRMEDLSEAEPVQQIETGGSAAGAARQRPDQTALHTGVHGAADSAAEDEFEALLERLRKPGV